MTPIKLTNTINNIHINIISKKAFDIDLKLVLQLKVKHGVAYSDKYVNFELK